MDQENSKKDFKIILTSKKRWAKNIGLSVIRFYLNSGKNLQVWVAPCRGSPSLHALAACDSRMDLVAQKMVPNIPKDPKAGGF